jgi:hypothetical protein
MHLLDPDMVYLLFNESGMEGEDACFADCRRGRPRIAWDDPDVDENENR